MFRSQALCPLSYEGWDYDMGRVGVEPTQHLCRRILSPLRLPIPPSPRIDNSKYMQSSQSVKDI